MTADDKGFYDLLDKCIGRKRNILEYDELKEVIYIGKNKQIKIDINYSTSFWAIYFEKDQELIASVISSGNNGYNLLHRSHSDDRHNTKESFLMAMSTDPELIGWFLWNQI